MNSMDERIAGVDRALARVHRGRPAAALDPCWNGRVMARVRAAAEDRAPAWGYLDRSAWRLAACAALAAVGMGLATGWLTGGFDETIGLFYLHNPSGIGGMEWMAY